MAVTQGRQDYTGQQLAAGIMQNALAQQTETYNQRRKALTDFVDNQLREGYHITSIARLNPGLMEELSTYDPGFKNFVTSYKDSEALMTPQQRMLELHRFTQLTAPQEVPQNIGSAAIPTTQPTIQAAPQVIPAVVPANPLSIASGNMSQNVTTQKPGSVQINTPPVPMPSRTGLETPQAQARIEADALRDAGQQKTVTVTPPETITQRFGTSSMAMSQQEIAKLQSAKTEMEKVVAWVQLADAKGLKEGTNYVKEKSFIPLAKDAIKQYGSLEEAIKKAPNGELLKNSVDRIAYIDGGVEPIARKLGTVITPPTQPAPQNVGAAPTTTPSTTTGMDTQGQPSTGSFLDTINRNRQARYELVKERFAGRKGYEGAAEPMQSALNMYNQDPDAFLEFYDNASFNKKIMMKKQVLDEKLAAYGEIRDAVKDEQWSKAFGLDAKRLALQAKELGLKEQQLLMDALLAEQKAKLNPDQTRVIVDTLQAKLKSAQEGMKNEKATDNQKKIFWEQYNKANTALQMLLGDGVGNELVKTSGLFGSGLFAGAEAASIEKANKQAEAAQPLNTGMSAPPVAGQNWLNRNNQPR